MYICLYFHYIAPDNRAPKPKEPNNEEKLQILLLLSQYLRILI